MGTQCVSTGVSLPHFLAYVAVRYKLLRIDSFSPKSYEKILQTMKSSLTERSNLAVVRNWTFDFRQ
jgi:hypothetical protein